jgi:hypothetical protein
MPKIQGESVTLWCVNFKLSQMIFRGISMMKINGYRRFDFPTRYYDERKEQLKSKQRAYDRLHQKEAEGSRSEILRSKISDSWVRNDEYRKSIWNANLRLVLVLGVLLLVVLVFAGLSDIGEFLEKFKTGG